MPNHFQPVSLRICFLLSFCLAISFSNAQIMNNPDKKVKVMILATFHFVSNMDGIKTQKVDMMTDQKQKEIEALNNSLEKFEPSKIFIEWRPSAQTRVDSTFREYLQGKYQLTANEVHQLGFRLAKELGHNKVYCMDAPGKYMADTVMKTAARAGQSRYIDSLYTEWTIRALREDSIQSLLPLKERLSIINLEKNIMDIHALNVGTLVAPYVGEVGDYAGAEFMGEWYKRNIRMFSNIVRSIEQEDKAILIIVGAGHARILQHFFEDDPGFEVVSPLSFLE